MDLNIITYEKNQRVYKAYLSEWFLEVLQVLKKEKPLKNKDRLKAMELSLVFVNEKRAKKINFEFRGVNKATDVLSFLGDGFVSLGELVFCLSKVHEKAQNSGLQVKHYMALMLTHGVLHLLGYEHENDAVREKEMFKLQNKIMRKVAAKLAHEHKTSFDVI